MRHRNLCRLLVGCSLGIVDPAFALDVPIAGLKLIVVDKTVAGKAKAVFVAKDGGVTKGTGTDPNQIEATLDIAYDAVSGTFGMPQGGNWLANSSAVAKYVNKTAPTGGAVKVAVIKPTSLVKVVGKSLGDTPLDISSAPSGPVYVANTIVNAGDETRLCTQFNGCVHKAIAGGTGYKLVCKGSSTDDPTCAAAVTTTTTSTSSTTTTSLPAGKLVFITSLTFTGNLGSLAGADAICNSLAAAAGLPGTYMPWLAGAGVGPVTRFTHATEPYVRVDGVPIANDWADLIDGALLAPINVTETGATVSTNVWTNVNSTGAVGCLFGDASCIDWQVDLDSYSGCIGLSSQSDSTWAGLLVLPCDVAQALYCFQQ